MSLAILIDTHFHGKFLISSLNFLLYNVYRNVGIHYGTHPWHWYLTQGYPMILCLHGFLLVFGVEFKQKLYFPMGCIIFNIFIYRFDTISFLTFINRHYGLQI